MILGKHIYIENRYNIAHFIKKSVGVVSGNIIKLNVRIELGKMRRLVNTTLNVRIIKL
jgi:hypothetical protein